MLIYFLPGFLLAQSSLSNTGTNTTQPVRKDTVAQNQNGEDSDEVAPPRQARKKLFQSDGKTAADDWKRNGLFHGLFDAGVNFAQIDGDAYAGYNKVGFVGGGGVLVRFHKYLSASMEIEYSMMGAQANFIDRANLYDVKLNYAQIPIAINVHDKDIIMFSAGMNISMLVTYSERNELGQNITDTVQPQPKKVDVEAFAALHFIIKKQFAIGLKYSYSMVPFRGVEDRYIYETKIHGEYNNVLTLRFMYILSAVKKK